MTNFALRLPESTYEDLKSVAKMEGVSINQFINCALSERIALAKVSNKLRKSTKKLSKGDFINFLEVNIPNIDPDDNDAL